jgi:PhoPQ-activated pathogenicity-related protein
MIFRSIRQPIWWTALFTVIALSQASAQVKVRGTPMENVDLNNASIEEIHQVAERDANLVWSLMRTPDPIEHKVSIVTEKQVQEKAATLRVYARLHRLEGDAVDVYVEWALARLGKLRQNEHH